MQKCHRLCSRDDGRVARLLQNLRHRRGFEVMAVRGRVGAANDLQRFRRVRSEPVDVGAVFAIGHDAIVIG